MRRALRSLGLLVLALLGPGSSSSAGQDLYGIHADSGVLYTISTVNTSVSVIGSTGIPAPTSLILAPDGFLYSVSSSLGGILYQIDPATANAAQVGFLWPSGFGTTEGDLTIDSNGVVIGSSVTGPSLQRSLFSVNLTTGQGTVGAVLSGFTSSPYLRGMVARSDGMLVGVHYQSSAWILVQVDPVTGVMAQIAPLLPVVGGVAGMTAFGDTAYLVTGAASGGSNEVWSVNLFTGTHQRVRSLVGFVGGQGFSGVAAKPSLAPTEYCFGDSAGVNCPCSNNSAWGANAGCLNSTGSAGRLRATGAPVVGGDTVAFHADGLLPVPTGLFFQGRMPQAGGVGLAFGDGLLCVNTSVVRLGIRVGSGGSVSFGFGVAGDPLVSVAGNVPASGGTRYYQFWYRDSVSYCTPGTYNLTNGIRLVWRP